MNARAITQVAPLIVLGVALAALIFHAVPEGNKDMVIAIISGLLGYLTKEAQQFFTNAPDAAASTTPLSAPDIHADPQS